MIRGMLHLRRLVRPTARRWQIWLVVSLVAGSQVLAVADAIAYQHDADRRHMVAIGGLLIVLASSCAAVVLKFARLFWFHVRPGRVG